MNKGRLGEDANMIKEQFGATSLGESLHRFKTDVNLVFGQQRKERRYVLRTTMHSLSVWKNRNTGIAMSPFKIKHLHLEKEAAIVDREVWVFSINATQSQDLVAAVKVASSYYSVSPSVIFSDIYAKNLNAEREDIMSNQALIRANRQLYSGACEAIIKAAKQLGITSQLNFYVFSKSDNQKLPQEDLHSALTEGGAKQVKTDEKRYKVSVGGNDDKRFLRQITNFHMATLQA